jgi:hypothetical protein
MYGTVIGLIPDQLLVQLDQVALLDKMDRVGLKELQVMLPVRKDLRDLKDQQVPIAK